MQVYYAVPGTGYTLTATSPASEFHRFEELLSQVVEGLAVRPAT
jgi:hypothetical protein